MWKDKLGKRKTGIVIYPVPGALFGCISMLKGLKCDLHIHTCLSPCADLDMYPSALVEKSLDSGLDVIGICDHNASENVRYVIEASRESRSISSQEWR